MKSMPLQEWSTSPSAGLDMKVETDINAKTAPPRLHGDDGSGKEFYDFQRHPSVQSVTDESDHTDSQHGELTQEYLTFDTVIPDLSRLAQGGVEIPNLTKYNSPFTWSNSRKNLCLILSCLSTFFAAYSAGSYSIASAPLEAKFGISQEVYQTGLTAWAFAFGASPMVLAPLSEINGRRPVFLASGCVFFIAQIGCAVTNSFAGMLVARFFVGAGASTFATIIGGVLSDVYHAEKRNTPMALYSSAVLTGTGLGPLISGFVVTRAGWRWVFWHQVIGLGVLVLSLAAFFKETRGSVLLSRKAQKINQFYDQLASTAPNSAPKIRYKVAADEARASLSRLLYLSLTTPFKLLFTEPVVFFFSLWAAFAWGVLYMTLNVVPLVFSESHDFDTEQIGAVFAAVVVGTALLLVVSIYQEKLARKYYPKLNAQPEGRLYFACLEAALLPAGLFFFGWTANSHTHWIVPCIALAIAIMGIFCIYLAVFNYLADVYHRYASSALACQSFCRNILAAVFPLFSTIMFKKIGFGPAGSLLGGISALLTVVPWVLVFFGSRIRARSKVASEIMNLQG